MPGTVSGLTRVLPSNPHNKPMRELLALCPLFRCGKTADDQLALRQLRAGRMQTQLKRQEQLAGMEGDKTLSKKHEFLLGPWTSIDEL